MVGTLIKLCRTNEAIVRIGNAKGLFLNTPKTSLRRTGGLGLRVPLPWGHLTAPSSQSGYFEASSSSLRVSFDFAQDGEPGEPLPKVSFNNANLPAGEQGSIKQLNPSAPFDTAQGGELVEPSLRMVSLSNHKRAFSHIFTKFFLKLQ